MLRILPAFRLPIFQFGRTLNMTPRSGSREVGSALYGEKPEEHVATTICLAGE